MEATHTTSSFGWEKALSLLEHYALNPTKSDSLLNDLPEDISSHDRRICQFLFLGVIRHKSLIQHLIHSIVRKKPRLRLGILLQLAIMEILEADASKYPKIIHFAVLQAKSLFTPKEAHFVNAVLRKIPECLAHFLNEPKDTSPDWMAIRYSHPSWLVDRWHSAFGLEATQALLKWNQEPPPLYLRWRDPVHAPPTSLMPTPWPGFYAFNAFHRDKVSDCVKAGKAYIQDPSTLAAPLLLNPQPDEAILDLCAAPGGKSMIIAESLAGGQGQLVALDLPKPRLALLRENLSRLKALKTTIVDADLTQINPHDLEARSLPSQYNAVLLDAPCSNTGVIRRRPDVKWRLNPQDITKITDLQYTLLERALAFVAPGGRLVYSTCSIEWEENEGVVDRFLADPAHNVQCTEKQRTFPWLNNYDGGGCFLFQKKS